MKRFAVLLWFTLHTVALLAADPEIGTPKQEVLNAWGQPRSYIKIGREETLIYDKNVRVYLKDGKVYGFKNRNLVKAGESPNPPAKPVATPAAPGAAPGKPPEPAPVMKAETLTALPVEEITPPDLTDYVIPKVEFINEASYRAAGTWGGDSDGKTVGIDGQPLADHKQYYVETSEFLNLMRDGVKLVYPATEVEGLKILYPLARSKTLEEAQSWADRFVEQQHRQPDDDPLYGFACGVIGVEKAYYAYQLAEGILNAEERITLRDRVSLDAPNASPSGKQHRLAMKQAVWAMEHWRKHMLETYSGVFQAALAEKERKDEMAAADEKFSTVAVDNSLLFAYSSFDRTPLLAGLAQAAIGEVLEEAHPLLMPKGAKVMVLESRQVRTSLGKNQPAMDLDIVRVSIKNPELKQLNGARISMSLEGWTLKKSIAEAK